MKLILFLLSCTLVYTVTADGSNGECTNLGPGLHLKPKTGCKSYYSCDTEGTGVVYECPDGYLFDDEEKVCAKEGSFVCESGPPPVCPEEGVSQIPIPGTACKGYYLCAEGEAFPQTCGEGNWFWS